MERLLKARLAYKLSVITLVTAAFLALPFLCASDARADEGGIIVAFVQPAIGVGGNAEFDGYRYHPNDNIYKYYESIPLFSTPGAISIKSLEAKVKSDGQADEAAVESNVPVTWQCVAYNGTTDDTNEFIDGQYDMTEPGYYRFSLVPAAGYTVAAGANPPTVQVYVDSAAETGNVSFELNDDWKDIGGAERSTVTIVKVGIHTVSSWYEVDAAFRAINEMGYTITRLDAHMFGFVGDSYNDTKFTIPDTVINIGNATPDTDFSDDPGGAFGNSGITEIIIPKGVKVISDHAFYHCEGLETITFEAGSELKSIGSMAFEGCSALESVEIPAGVETIGDSAFDSCDLNIVKIPDGVQSIGAKAFANNDNLTEVTLTDQSELRSIGDKAFASGTNETGRVKFIFIPESVNDIQGNPFDTGSMTGWEKATINAHYDSYAAWWARGNGFPFLVAPSTGEMRSHPPDLMYKYIPYEFIAKTKAPDNAGLRFWLTDRQGNPLALPAGMYLADGVVDLSHTPGTIYGSPLDYTDFENGVAFTMHAQNIGGGFTAAVDFTVRLAPTPANAWLEANLNKYPLISDPIYGGDGHIGEWDAENGRYVIYGVYEDVTAQIFYIGDIMEGGALINSFEHFDSFWLDGIKQEIVTQYEAEDGSTRVTILAQTIRDLDNGEHTAAAAFRRTDAGESADIDAYASWNGGALGDNLDVVAQNFTVNLSARPAPGGGDSGDGDGDSGDSGDSGVGDGGGSGGSGTGGGTSDDDNTGDTGGAGDSGTGDGDSGTGAVSGAGDGGGSGTGGDEIGGTGGAGGGDSGDSGTGEAAEPADLAGPAVPAVPALPVEAAGPAAPAEPAALTETAGGSDQGPDGGGPAVSGLPVDENGRFYFALDGSGAPLELRIDIPLEEFGELYFDGALWAVGPDYAVRSGSTVLTVAAGRLERYEAGIHSFTARFAATTVEISFTLVKSAVPPAARLPATEENAGLPLPAAAALALTFLAGGAIVFTRARKAKTVK